MPIARFSTNGYFSTSTVGRRGVPAPTGRRGDTSLQASALGAAGADDFGFGLGAVFEVGQDVDLELAVGAPGAEGPRLMALVAEPL